MADEVQEEGGRELRSFMEILEPGDSSSTWRDLPHLLVASFRLVWEAGRRELFVTSTLQILSAAGIAAQLFVGRALFAAVLGAHGAGFSSVLPSLGLFVGITVALDGDDLSIGQWQRLALARAFFRDASLVILDEPTAALDARAENALFTRMRALLEGRSAVLISHRFSSVRSADRI